MAKYKASPHYTINAGDIVINFGYDGIYETSDKDEIAILENNVPRYVKKIEEVVEPKKEEPKAEAKPKASTKRKTSAK